MGTAEGTGARGLFVLVQVLLHPHKHHASKTILVEGLCHLRNWFNLAGKSLGIFLAGLNTVLTEGKFCCYYFVV